MSFEFMYDGAWYKYDDGKLKKKNYLDFYDDYSINVPVLRKLQEQMEAVPKDVRHLVMQGILHAYGYGIVDGKKKKIAEFKRVFNLD